MVCATFPLIWVGGLVTTYDAGMAVPDWPSTFGYNLFAYPWQTWFFGPWDLFIEHGHRLLGALVGMIAIAFVVAVWRTDTRPSMRYAAIGALALVVVQGLLGGARVRMDARMLAMIHGCVGPAFFAYCVGLAVFTSKMWKPVKLDVSDQLRSRLFRLAMLVVLFAFLQLILGAQLRHVSVMASPGAFRAAVFFHLIMAAVLMFHIGQLLHFVRANFRSVMAVTRPAYALFGMIVVQLSLGSATWIVKYGWPEFLADYSFAAAHTIQAKSLLQSLVVTSHVATGSLVIAVSVLLLARAVRIVRVPTVALSSGAVMMELAT